MSAIAVAIGTSAVVGAAGTIIAGKSAKKGAQAQAEAQLEATRETNETNYKMFQEARGSEGNAVLPLYSGTTERTIFNDLMDTYVRRTGGAPSYSEAARLYGDVLDQSYNDYLRNAVTQDGQGQPLLKKTEFGYEYLDDEELWRRRGEALLEAAGPEKGGGLTTFQNDYQNAGRGKSLAEEARNWFLSGANKTLTGEANHPLKTPGTNHERALALWKDAGLDDESWIKAKSGEIASVDVEADRRYSREEFLKDYVAKNPDSEVAKWYNEEKAKINAEQLARTGQIDDARSSVLAGKKIVDDILTGKIAQERTGLLENIIGARETTRDELERELAMDRDQLGIARNAAARTARDASLREVNANRARFGLGESSVTDRVTSAAMLDYLRGSMLADAQDKSRDTRALSQLKLQDRRLAPEERAGLFDDNLNQQLSVKDLPMQQLGQLRELDATRDYGDFDELQDRLGFFYLGQGNAPQQQTPDIPYVPGSGQIWGSALSQLGNTAGNYFAARALMPQGGGVPNATNISGVNTAGGSLASGYAGVTPTAAMNTTAAIA